MQENQNIERKGTAITDLRELSEKYYLLERKVHIGAGTVYILKK